MTDFKPFKDKVWEAAKADDKAAFDKACDALMEKASKDMWRIGWSIYPKDIGDVFGLFKDIGTWCHKSWLEAMKNGDAPPEDVSPGEAFAHISKLVKEAIETKDLPPIEVTEWWVDHSQEDDDEEEDEDLGGEKAL